MTVRATAAQKRAASELLRTRGIDDQDFIDRLLMEIITANDEKTRFAVVVYGKAGEGHRAPDVFGPYATMAAASKAVTTGLLASKPDARGYVVPLITAPKKSEWNQPHQVVQGQGDKG